MSANLVLDIEAIVDPRNPGIDSKGEPVDFPAPVHWLIVAACGAWFDGFMLSKLGSLGPDEPTILERVRASAGRARLVTFNGRGFDVPVIAAAHLRLGLSWPWYYRTRDARYRYSVDAHVDVMDDLADYGGTRPATMQGTARSMGLPGKLGTSGGDVAALVAAGRFDDVTAYCSQDVAQQAAIFLRWSLLRGDLDLAGYRRAIGRWREVCEESLATRLVVDACDWARLSLPAPVEPVEAPAEVSP